MVFLHCLFQIKKSLVDQEYSRYKETDHPSYADYHLRRMICKSFIYVKKKIHSECVPLKCCMIIEGIKPPQDIDLLTESQESIILCTPSKSCKCVSQQIIHVMLANLPLYTFLFFMI